MQFVCMYNLGKNRANFKTLKKYDMCGHVQSHTYNIQIWIQTDVYVYIDMMYMYIYRYIETDTQIVEI